MDAARSDGEVSGLKERVLQVPLDSKCGYSGIFKESTQSLITPELAKIIKATLMFDQVKRIKWNELKQLMLGNTATHPQPLEPHCQPITNRENI
jgi:hypothetical protein